MNMSQIGFVLVLSTFLYLYPISGIGQVKAKEKSQVKGYALLGDSASPEGISIDPRNGNIYTGGMQDGSLQVTSNGTSRYLVAPRSGILLTNVLGSAVDAKNNRIWVCSNDFSKTFDGIPTARVSVLDLSNGQLIKQFDETDLASEEGVYPFVNDVVLGRAGNAYVSNSASNNIFKISFELERVEVLASKFPEAPAGKKYSLNGIEVSHDQQFLISNSFVMTEEDAAALFRINIATGEVSLIEFEESGTTDFSRSGGDGLLMLDKNTLLCMSVSSKLLKVELNKELTKATITNISKGTSAQEEMVGCATMAMYRNKLYTTNAQGMSLFNPDVAVQKPYKIIEIPKKILGL